MKILPILIVSIFLLGCSEEANNQSEITSAVAPDAGQLVGLSAQELRSAVNRAQQGDIEAAKSLYDHYLAEGDERQVERWESWLIERNDPDALGRRAEVQFLRARDLSDTDPAKLEILKKVADLNARARYFHVPSEGSVLINGNPVDFSEVEKNTADETTNAIQVELKRVQSIQSR